MGDFERRSEAEQAERARKAQAKVDDYRRELTEETGRRCETCKFWDSSTSHIAHPDRSPCRIHPPTTPINHEIGVWPFTANDEWCGQHLLDGAKVDGLCLEFARENARG